MRTERNIKKSYRTLVEFDRLGSLRRQRPALSDRYRWKEDQSRSAKKRVDIETTHLHRGSTYKIDPTRILRLVRNAGEGPGALGNIMYYYQGGEIKSPDSKLASGFSAQNGMSQRTLTPFPSLRGYCQSHSDDAEVDSAVA